MGHRTVKRVPLDFDWPQGEVWQGYLLPDKLHEGDCPDCERGYSVEAERLFGKWYGRVPFHPWETGSQPFTIDEPGVRAFAERNIAHSPSFYGSGEYAIRREAQRLADLWNGMWAHHLEQADVDALIAANRLHDFTHTWSREDGWQPRDPMPEVTASEVNAKLLGGLGHDSINASVVIKAKCERLGIPKLCSTCHGHGTQEKYEGQRAEAEAWEPTEPPVGNGWQLWETVSEGSPQSPVFTSAEELAAWCEGNATWFAGMRWTRAEWLASFQAGTTDVDSLLVMRAER